MKKEFYTKLDKEVYEKLKEKSEKIGLKPTSYNRMLIYKDLEE